MKERYPVLIVDDEPEILALLSNYLTLEGYQVTTTSSPHEALKIIEKGQARILLTDLVMPEIDGVELIARAKEMDGLIQVIVATGFVSMASILSVFRLGANNCLFKPFEDIDLVKKEIDLAIDKLERLGRVLRQRPIFRKTAN